jgi:hypothetical protein
MGSDDGEEDGRVGEGKTAVGGVTWPLATQPIGRRTRLTGTGTQLRAPLSGQRGAERGGGRGRMTSGMT